MHEGRLELQGQRLGHRHPRLVEKVGSAELLGVERIVEGTGRICHHRDEHHKQKDMGDVELPHPVVDADPSYHETLALHGATVHDAGGVAGDEDEHLGRVREHHRLERKLRQDIVGEVIDEDAKKGEAAEKIKPEVALHSRRTARDAHNLFPVTSLDRHQRGGRFAPAWNHNPVVLKGIHDSLTFFCKSRAVTVFIRHLPFSFKHRSLKTHLSGIGLLFTV